jgi:hypothetical protein
VKEMQSLGFSGQMQELSSTYLIHNRLNTKWMPSEKLSFVLEMRNRLIWGDDVKNIPGYGSLLRNANEKIDLSKIWFSGSSIILHSNLDRLYADLKLKNTGLKLGRQRINWGIASTWNPNDIFNSYNFLDFDYEERPGSDAIRFSANISSFSGLELAASPSNKNAGKVLARQHGRCRIQGRSPVLFPRPGRPVSIQSMSGRGLCSGRKLVSEWLFPIQSSGDEFTAFKYGRFEFRFHACQSDAYQIQLDRNGQKGNKSAFFSQFLFAFCTRNQSASGSAGAAV